MAGTHAQYERLLEAGLALAAELSLPAALQRIVELAAELTGARYGALGVLGRDGTISEFITTGVTEEQRAAIGHIPVGRGILGVLIDNAGPLRLRDIAEDPRSVGFPANHPPMHSFLGAPVTARGRVYGNLYLTEKQGGEDFDADDERALVLLAAQAGVAIENAQLYEEARDRAQRLEAIRAITTAILAGTDTEELLALVVRHARELAGADLATLARPAGAGRLTVEAADGLLADQLRGTAFPAEGSVTGEVIRTGKAVVLADASADERVVQPIVRAQVGPAMFVPLAVRDTILGTLTVANAKGGPLLREAAIPWWRPLPSRPRSRSSTAASRESCNAWPCSRTGSGSPRSCTTGPSRPCSRSAWACRARPHWRPARSSAAGSRMPWRRWTGSSATYATTSSACAPASSPTASSTRPSIHRLVEEFGLRTGMLAIAEVDPGVAAELTGRAADVIQLAREALSNVSRHAQAVTCRVSLYRDERGGVLEVDDDGHGFDPARTTGTGQGLRNLRERAESLGGRAEIDSTPGQGTRVRVTIPR
jgi:two-component system, NarL family, sensor histidine kinase DevS